MEQKPVSMVLFSVSIFTFFIMNFALRRDDREPSKCSRVCSCHFRDGDKRNLPTIRDRNKEKLFDLLPSAEPKPPPLKKVKTKTDGKLPTVKSVLAETGFTQKTATIFQRLFKGFSRTTLDFQGPPTKNTIAHIVQKCTFSVYSSKTLRLELFASPTSLHFFSSLVLN